MALGPDNDRVTMADVIEIEDMAKRKLPLEEIARRKRIPYWRVEEICRAMKVAVRA